MWIAAQQTGDRLHLWVLDGSDASYLTQSSDVNCPFEDQVLGILEPHLPKDGATLVVCSGVSGAPFVQVPAAVGSPQQIASATQRLALFALPRLAQSQPVDVMQGEEATVTGLLAQFPEWDGVLCLTGPSTRWVHISAGEVVSFRSFMTGELFELLGAHSSLNSALMGDDWDSDAFDTALNDAMSRPERFGATLATLRARSLLLGAQASSARANLSGALIGAELAAARPYWLGQNVALIGEGEIADCYNAALKGQGAMLERHAAHDLALRGLRDVYEKLRRN